MLRADWIEGPVRLMRAQRGECGPCPPTPGRRWGLADLDALATLGSTDVIVIGVPPSRTEALPDTTGFAFRLALRLGIHGPVALFTPCSGDDLASAIVAADSGVYAHRVRAGVFAPDEERRVLDSVERLQDTNVMVDDRLGLTCDELEAEVERISQNLSPTVVIDRPELLLDDCLEIARRMKALAVEVCCPIVGVCSANHVADRPADAVGLPGHGGIARDADLVAWLDGPPRAPELRIFRSRRGTPPCVVPLRDLSSAPWNPTGASVSPA